MPEKFQNKYRIPSARLQGYDYGSNGFYFVTICTKNRNHYFGDIVVVETGNCPSQKDENPSKQTGNCPSERYPANTIETHNCASLRPTIIGQTAIDFWAEIPKHYPFVELDEFVVMPNHLHGILFFNKPDKTDWQPNQFGVQSQNLGAVIRAFKSSVKRDANENDIEFEWQSRYHDRIIRNERALNAIRKYIIDNPLNWNNDVLYKAIVETGHCPSTLETDNDPSTLETDNDPSLHNDMEYETENLLKEMGG
jgi:REP element-mobilizing transposase RayT